MTESFTVESNERGASLTLRTYDNGYYIAHLRHPGLDAKVKVGSYLFGGFGDFFATLAQNWNGWQGVREWASLEGEFKLSAASDRTGHVQLRARLDDGAPANWRAELVLALEAGQLEGLVAEAKDFERSVLSAT